MNGVAVKLPRPVTLECNSQFASRAMRSSLFRIRAPAVSAPHDTLKVEQCEYYFRFLFAK